jgi:hypothetical protein
VAELGKYRPNVSDLAAEFVLSLPRKPQKKVMGRAYELARYPFIESDYTVVDTDGRAVEHLLIEGFVFSCWVDHAVQLVMITEIDDAE